VLCSCLDTLQLTQSSTEVRKLTGLSAHQEIKSRLCDPKVFHRVHNCPPTLPVPRSVNAAHTHTVTHTLTQHIKRISAKSFQIFFRLSLRLPSWDFPSIFSTKLCRHFLFPLHVQHDLLNSSSFDCYF
jgi:hypothetical protein